MYRASLLSVLFCFLFYAPFLSGQACDTMEVDFSSSAPACTGEGLDFVNTGSSDAAYDYSWDFGSGASPATSTNENPSGVTYSSAGTKTVTFTISDPSAGCVLTETKGITIHEEPSVSFNSSAPACEGRSVNFTNTGSSGGGWTYSWDFGNGATPSTSTAENPSGISYSSSGSKTVTLTITDDNGHCSATQTQTINIAARPDASIASTAPACTGEDVDLSNTGTSGGIYTYQWDLGSGASPTTSPAENPSGVTYSSSGIKSVRLVIGNTSTGCTDTAWKDITIHQTPTPGFANTAPACEGEAVDFVNTGSSGPQWTYQWDLGAGASPNTSTAEDPSGISYSGSGSKTITQTISSEHCQASFSTSITVEATPDAGFAHGGPGCTGDTVSFTNTGSSGGSIAHSWDLGSDASPVTSSMEDPEAVYSSDGNKQVMQVLENTSSGCTDTATQSVTLHPTPDTGFTSTAPVCEEVGVDLTNTGSSGSQWTYSWDFGQNASPNTSTAENPGGISYDGSGSKTVTQTITDDNGFCSATKTQTIIILPRPDASFNDDGPACTGEQVAFTNTGSSGGSYTYSWDFGANSAPSTSTLEEPSTSYNASGNKQVRQVIEHTGSGCTDTAWNSINIHQTPNVGFNSSAPECAGEEVDFANTGSSGPQWSYQWDFGSDADPVASSAEDPSGIRFSNGGNKLITLTISSPHCQRMSSGQISIDSLPQVDAGPDTTVCADRCAKIGTAPTADHSYDWFPSNTLDTADGAQPTACPDAQVTQYLVTETDTFTQCSATDSVTVTMVQSAVADAGPDVEICEGDSVQIGTALIEGQSYRWSPAAQLSSDTLPNPYAHPDSSRIYTVKTSYEGCDTVTDDVKVTVHPLPDVKVQDEEGKVDSTKISKGADIRLIASGAVQYDWMPEWGLDNPGVHDPMASPEEDTLYRVKGTDMNGCVNSDSIHVRVIEPEVWAPNAFTPDGDGRNDRFYIRAQGVQEFRFSVFDRSGKLVFRTERIDEGWDGTVQGSGEKLPQGAYVYRASGTLSDGTQFNRKGMINLLR